MFMVITVKTISFSSSFVCPFFASSHHDQWNKNFRVTTRGWLKLEKTSEASDLCKCVEENEVEKNWKHDHFHKTNFEPVINFREFIDFPFFFFFNRAMVNGRVLNSLNFFELVVFCHQIFGMSLNSMLQIGSIFLRICIKENLTLENNY